MLDSISLIFGYIVVSMKYHPFTKFEKKRMELKNHKYFWSETSRSIFSLILDLFSKMNRQKLEDAMKERDRMEKRMKEIISYLNQPGLLFFIIF